MKKVEAKLKNLNEKDTGNTCEKCHKEFKYTIQKKRHKCEVKNDEVNNITTIISRGANNDADDKFNVPSPSDHQKIFSCKICRGIPDEMMRNQLTTKENKLEDIKRHYLLQHYKENLLAYPFLRKEISYPAKCLRAKDGCDKEIANLDEYW